MRHKFPFFIVMLVILLVVVACGGQNENTAAATTEPASTHTTAPDPTSTNAATSTSLPTATNTATSTSLPTFTFTPSNTPPPSFVATSGTHIYTAPDENSTESTMTNDITVTILAVAEGEQWYQVRTPFGRIGWIRAGEVIGLSISFLADLPRVTLAPTSTQEPAMNTPRPQPTNAQPAATNTRPAVTNTPASTSTLAPATVTTAPTQPPASPTNTPPPAATCDCSGNLYNCSDFATHAAAQACFNYCVSQGVGDIHGLDADGDGDACESLP